MFIIKKLKNSKIGINLFNELKKIKPDSLICSFSHILVEKYFDYLKKNQGIIVSAFKFNKIIGILIFEKSSKNTLDFLANNKLKIFLNLFFSKDLLDKKKLFSLIFNFFFFKKHSKFFKNNIVLFAINKRFRGKHIGKKMVSYLRTKVKEKIYVMTDNCNYSAKYFYKKNNFIFLNNIKYGKRLLSVFYSNKIN
jgi:ribosomal protein S18 acetylase RimI-like enzyme